MSIESYRVAIGACGWKHEAWQNDFYPDDLPGDWMLGFYGNEFPVVYVPAQDWTDEPDISDWSGDISETFRFILELPAACIGNTAAFGQAITKARSLGEYCLGLVFVLDDSVENDLSEFQSRLESAQQVAPVCVDIQGAGIPAEFKERLISGGISEVWHGPGQKPASETLARGKLSIARVDSDSLDAAKTREVLETLLSVATDERVCVLSVDGHPPSLEVMRNADIILNLL